jgi:hypothetical protein
MPDPMDFMTPGPQQLAGPGMDANNAMVGRQAWAQQALKDLLLKRAMAGMQGGPMAPPPQMLGAPPVRSMAPPQMLPAQPPFGGPRGY